MRGGFALIFRGFQIILAVALILLQIQRGFAAVIVPIFGVFLLGVVCVVLFCIIIKTASFVNGKETSLYTLPSTVLKLFLPCKECFIKVRVNQRICCDGILGS